MIYKSMCYTRVVCPRLLWLISIQQERTEKCITSNSSRNGAIDRPTCLHLDHSFSWLLQHAIVQHSTVVFFVSGSTFADKVWVWIGRIVSIETTQSTTLNVPCTILISVSIILRILQDCHFVEFQHLVKMAKFEKKKSILLTLNISSMWKI